MQTVKKSLNLNKDLVLQLEAFIQQNPSISFTLIVNQAIEQWLKRPSIELNNRPFTDEDVDSFLEDNAELMKDLAIRRPECKKSALKNTYKKAIKQGKK